MNVLSHHLARALLALGLLACAVVFPAAPEAQAQGVFLIYGNFCGPGNRGPDYPPIDALDLACAHHDACSPDMNSGVMPDCACNRRLQVEAGLVARDLRAPQQTRDMARFISDFAGSAVCR